MRTKVRRVLMVVPLGLLASSFLVDVAYLVSGHAQLAEVSWWLIVVGVLGGLVAAVVGATEVLGTPRGTRGAVHALANFAVGAAFAASGVLRAETIQPGTGALVLSALGAALAVITGWLSGALVDGLAVGDPHLAARRA